jgi:hypothetical protein
MSSTETGVMKADHALRMSTSSFHLLDQPALASDILRGIREVTLFMRGVADKKAIRSMYHATETSNTVPTFKLAGMTCARKSSIRATIWLQEKRTWTDTMQEDLVRLHILMSSILSLLSNADRDGICDEAKFQAVVAECAVTIQRVLQFELK